MPVGLSSANKPQGCRSISRTPEPSGSDSEATDTGEMKTARLSCDVLSLGAFSLIAGCGWNSDKFGDPGSGERAGVKAISPLESIGSEILL